MTFAVATAMQLDLIHPSDHVSTGRDEIVVVGHASSEDVAVELNGEIVARPRVKNSTFHYRVQLPYGFNTITISAGDSITGFSSETIEALRGPKVKTQIERLYPNYSFHDETPRTACLECHARERFLPSEASDAQWCATCHSENAARFETHAPADERACTNCHVFAADLTLIEGQTFEEKNRCYGCHNDKIGEFAREYIHGPVAGGACVICHDPHGSLFKPNLVAPVAILCLGCHADSMNEEASFQHRPFEEGKCTACHNPHSTNNRWVLIRNSRELCLDCHGDSKGKFKEHRHPFDVKPQSSVYGLRLSENGELECLTCHSPHASAAKHLLRTSGSLSCTGCHPEHR